MRRIQIVMGLYRPEPTRLAGQIRSIAAQTAGPITLHACVDGAGALDAPGEAAIAAGLAGAQVTLALHRFEENRGVRGNFLRGLAGALEGAGAEDLFAFSDQDDVWAPEKLARQVAMLEDPGVALCHHDARVVDGAGAVLHPSMFAFERRLTAPDPVDLFFVNSVTGMTMLFRRAVAERAVAERAVTGVPADARLLHDHWVALVAAALGRIGLIEAPLADYVQHGANEVGAGQHQTIGWGRAAGRVRATLEMLRDRRAARLAMFETLERVVGDAPGWPAMRARIAPLAGPQPSLRALIGALRHARSLPNPAVRESLIRHIAGTAATALLGPPG
ncbi:MAG: glycosyltransferase [Pseudomonadota bacterium]